MSLTSEVKEAALKLGADLVGIAPIGRFADAPPEYDPLRLLPETRTLISVAVRHLKGVMLTQQRLIDNYPYQIFGYGWLSHIRINMILFELARGLEDRGYMALPYPSFCESDPSQPGYKSNTGLAARATPISNRHAAVAAGLAQFGLSNVVLTPEFGPRQRLGTILTTAPLEPDPMLRGQLCDNCGICVEACPAGAIGPEPEVSFHIGDQLVEIAALARDRCRWYHFGLSPRTFGPLDIAEPVEITRDLFEEKLSEVISEHRFFLDRYIKTFAPAGYCGMCLASCPKGKYNPE
ncbi:MAG: epoxyqueuosine reductase [Armatimonadetes bacterium]|nr:epoxyqueuosine reductase [Armatimonadota bacterium]